MERPKTIFLDIDGVLFYHFGNQTQQISLEPSVLPGVIEKLNEWDRCGYNIILTTGRKESSRQLTEKQLFSVGIFYDQLVMGIGGGTRVLINDYKVDSLQDTAIAVCVERNRGLADVKI